MLSELVMDGHADSEPEHDHQQYDQLSKIGKIFQTIKNKERQRFEDKDNLFFPLLNMEQNKIEFKFLKNPSYTTSDLNLVHIIFKKHCFKDGII